MGEAEDRLYESIDAIPKVKCSKCGHDKHPVLFTPSQLKRPHPRCRMCCRKANGGNK